MSFQLKSIFKATKTSAHPDWSRTPAAVFASIVLGIASISGLAWSWDRAIEQDSKSDTQLTQTSSQSRSTIKQSPDPVAISAIKRIDVNSADAALLDLLPGIGPALAQRIIADRDEHGAFESVDDLERVSGIGPKTVKKIRSQVIIGDSVHPSAADGKGG